MRKTIICLAVLLMAAPLAAQRRSGSIDPNIFDDLQYRSSDRRYSATLKQDIFDNLTFTDNRRNEIVFEKGYLAASRPEVLGNGAARRDFFNDLVNRHRSDEGYRARFSVDVSGTLIMEDNRGNRTEEKIDIFGHKSYEETRNGRRISIRRDLHGDLEYRSGRETASLGKTFNRGKWVYEDSAGNRFEFGERTWNELMGRFGDDEQIFRFLVDRFLHD